MSLPPSLNPMGSSFSMSPPPPQGYIDYFNSLKNVPPNKNINSKSVLPLDKKKLEQLKALNDYKKMINEKNKILPMKHYTDQPHTSVHSEPEYKTNTKPSKTHNVDIHHQKHLSPKPQPMTQEQMDLNERKFRHANAMRLEQGLGALSIQEQYPVKTKINMNMNLPKPKPTPKATPPKKRVDAMGFPLDLPSIADAVRNPAPKIKNNNSGSFTNPTFAQY